MVEKSYAPWRFGCVLASSILAAISFPTAIAGYLLPDFYYLAFIAWVPLLLALHGLTPKKTFLLASLGQGLHFVFSLYWVVIALHDYGPMPLPFSLGLALLMWVPLGFYLGAVFGISRYLANKFQLSEWYLRPCIWLLIEFLRNYFPFGGFPWNQFGYTQSKNLFFIQLADLVGVYGVSFILYWVNEALATIILTKKIFHKSMIAALGLLVFAYSYGYYRLQQLSHWESNASIKVVTLQPNIPQDEKWLNEMADEILEILKEQSRAAEAMGADLILWPEASSPYILANDMTFLPFELGIRKSDVLLSAVTIPLGDYLQEKIDKAKNTALLSDANGHVLDMYHKVHLVPFGEYIPLKFIFFFVNAIAGYEGDLTPGDVYRPLQYQKKPLAVLICFEDLFPEISRAMVAAGAEALINTSNDAWYNQSSAAYQHLVFSQFRAIESRRELLRSTNTGVSAQIDMSGKILWRSELSVKAIYPATLHFYQQKSFYSRNGDFFPFILGLFCLGMMLCQKYLQKKL